MKSSAALLFFFLFLPCAALAFPLSEGTIGETIVFTADGSVKEKTLFFGTFEDDGQDWENNCSGLLRQELPGEISSTAECSFSKRIGAAELSLTVTHSKNFLREMSSSAGNPDIFGSEKIGFKETPSELRISFPLKGLIPSQFRNFQVERTVVRVEGVVSSLRPLGYKAEGEAFVFEEPSTLDEDTLSVAYQAGLSSLLFGGRLLEIIIVSIVLAVVLLLLAFKSRGRVEPKVRKPEEIKRVLDASEKKPSPTSKANEGLVAFVESHLQEGYSVEQIREALVNAGLSGEEIEAAISEVLKKRMVTPMEE